MLRPELLQNRLVSQASVLAKVLSIKPILDYRTDALCEELQSPIGILLEEKAMGTEIRIHTDARRRDRESFAEFSFLGTELSQNPFCRSESFFES